ncbi:MAG TPA: hypothetical protein VNO30_26735 [Kofleriaceae bacterium]|nr:hypothetical protein [Kofleriaceae bacterium]
MKLVPLAAAAALGSIALAACYRDRAPDGVTGARTEEGRAAAAATASSDALAFLPVDAELVLGVDVRQVVGSPLWKQFESQIMGRIGPRLGEIRAACGYEPLDALRSVTIGVKLAEPFDGVIVVRGLPRDKTLACIGRALPSRPGITVERGVVTIPGDGPNEPPAVMAFAGATTLVLTTSRPKLDAALMSGAPLRGSRAFTELWGLVNARDAIWGVVNGAARAFDALASFGVRPRAVLGSASLANGLSMTGRMRLGTPDEATQLAALGQSQIGSVQSMAEKVEVGADGTDVTLRVDMTTAQVDTITRMMLSMAGSMFGGP